MYKLNDNLLNSYINNLSLETTLSETRSDYYNAIEEIVDLYHDFNGVKAIYEYGSRKSVRYSDIDLIVVLEEDGVNDFSSIESLGKSKKLEKLLGGGNIMFFPEKLFVLIKWIDEIKLTRIYGHSYDVDIVNDDFNMYLYCARVIDWLPERLLLFVRIINNKLGLHFIIGLLFSILYTFRILNKMGIVSDIFIYEYSKKISKIRSYPEKYKNNDEFRKDILLLTESAVDNGYRFLLLLENYMINNNIVSGTGLEIPRNAKINLTEDIGYIRTSGYTFSSNIKPTGKGLYLQCPDIVFCQWQKYADYDGCLSKKINSSISFTNKALKIKSNKYEFILKKRIEIINLQYDFLTKHNIKSGLFRMGWFL
jgi:hypothetical protein